MAYNIFNNTQFADDLPSLTPTDRLFNVVTQNVFVLFDMTLIHVRRMNCWLLFYLLLLSNALILSTTIKRLYLPFICTSNVKLLLTVNGICLFRQINGINPPKNSETTKVVTMQFLPDVGIYKEAQNQKKLT